MEDKKDKIANCLSELDQLELSTYGKDFLLTWEKSESDIRGIACLAQVLRDLHRQGKSFKVFDSGIAVSIFRDKSTRTRYSFQAAINALGLGLSDIDEEKSQISHGETVRETANMLSFLTEVIGIRDDMYLGEGNAYMREVANAVSEGFTSGILHRRPTLVNLQCDVDHPTQTMSDLLKLKEYFGSIEALRGKKIAMSWAYSPSYGKPLSVPQGIVGLMTRLGMHVVLAHPEGYHLLSEVEKIAAQNASQSGGSFVNVNSMEEAFSGADIVYPKSWAPFDVMVERTALLKKNDQKGLKELERNCLARNTEFESWECNRAMMDLTANKNALYMHCLPADISGVSCDKGEVSKEVFEQFRLETYNQASFKPFVIAAMIIAQKVKNPSSTLRT